MKTYKLFGLITILALLIVAMPVQGAKATLATLYVDVAGLCGGNTPCYLHPQDAVNAANVGDTVLVYPGTYDSRYQVCDPVHPTWCAPNDNWAPALIVYKDGLTIKSVEGPANTTIQSTHNFWSNAVAVENSTAGGVTGITGWNPSAIIIVANNVTIDGFTLRRPFTCLGKFDCFNNTAGVFIGSKGAGYPDFIGHANGATVKNNVFSDVWHAVYIWHSSGNLITNNTVNALTTDHWAAISAYDGWDNASIAFGNLSENNVISQNILANKGIALGAWAPSTWTSNAGSKVLCNTTTLVGITYSHGPVIVACNSGGFWESNTDNVLRITGITYTGTTDLVPVDPVTHLATVAVSAQLTYAGTSDGSGIDVTFKAGSNTVNATTASGGSASATMNLPPDVYNIEANVSFCELCGYTDSAVLVVYDPSGGFVTGGGWITSPEGAMSLPGPVVVWDQNFSTDASGWFGDGITIDSGVAEFSAPGGQYSHFDGYRDVWPGTYTAEIDVYLDPSWPADQGFDYSVASNGSDGQHQRDFIFHVGTVENYGPIVGKELLVAVDNNAYGDTNPFVLTTRPGGYYVVPTAGWYTLQHVFYDAGGYLAVGFNILDSNGNVVWSDTRSDTSDTIPGEVGGNRYAWFAHIDVAAGIQVDNHQLILDKIPSPEGRATFGFVSKYKKGATIPDGNTEFQFTAGNLNFHSTSYEWLVVNQAGANAQFKGYGTINGAGNYGFMLWAGDGSPDTFRIKIWDVDTEVVVYDNGTNQPIGGGSIVVHKK